MLTMRVTPKMSDNPAATKKSPEAAASPLSAWNRRASGFMEQAYHVRRRETYVGWRALVWSYVGYASAAGLASVWLCPRELDDLGPLLGFIGQDLTELRRGHTQRRAAKLDDSRADSRIGQRRVDLAIQFPDDFIGRALERAETCERAGLVAGDKLAHRRNVRQRLEARG